MGGSSKKQKVGNKYKYGFVLVVCRQMDALLEMRMSDKLIWSGQEGQGRISPNKPNAFGGDEREGGFSGDIDIQLGGNDQPVNDYWAAAKGGLTSALRGCVSLVFRQPYVSANTARLPTIATKQVNIKGIHRGWLPAKAVVLPDKEIEGKKIFIVMDMSNKVSTLGWAIQKVALAAFVRGMKGAANSVRIVCTQPSGGSSSIERFDCDDADYEDIALFIEARTRNNVNLTVNQVDLSTAASFFTEGEESGFFFDGPILKGSSFSFFDDEGDAADQNRYIIIVNGSTLGSGYIAAANVDIDEVAPVSVAAFRTTDVSESLDTSGLEQIDNTVFDGVPATTDPDEMQNAIERIFTNWLDMNPAHIIRCLWTDPMRGGSVGDDEIGDSFETAADLYIDEGMGFSPKFRGIDQVGADRQDIERHVDAISYRSNKTGKIELVSIRDDYDVGDLVTLDSGIVTDWSGLSRPRKSEIPNQLTVTYTRRDGKTGSVTRTNTAGVRRQGRVIKAEQIAYPSCTTEGLAIRLCMRDLRFVTTDILSGTIPLTYLPPDVEPGSVVIINEPLLNFNNILMRVSEVRIGKHDDASAWITVSEENFATTQEVEVPKFTTPDPRRALQVAHRLVTETSYFQGVFSIGQSTIDDELEVEPDLGRLIATGARANSEQLDATLATSTGDDWIDQGLVDFEPYGVLLNVLSDQADDDTFLVEFNPSLTDINAGDLARLGDEIIRIDDLVEQLDGSIEVTCGRGCLDGPPRRHAAGTAFVVSSVVEALPTDFVAGQSIDVKMLSRTGSDVLTLSAAETETVTFTSRAIRPYPVGNFQIDGEYFVPSGTGGTLTATWAHRDRTIQTTPAVDDHTAGNIGPETGVSYTPFKKIYDRRTDFFANSQFFGVPDIFVDFETSREYLYDDIASAQALTYDFDAGNRDWFDQVDALAGDDWFEGSYDDNTGAIAFGVRTSRGSSPVYDNWHDVEIRFVPSLPPINFEGEDI